METRLAPEFAATADGREAESILRACVHCGFCTATCPTYQLLGDELDGPRGRIYQIKQVLEGAAPSRRTQQHLDRCLSCRNCETTCPSGVAYGQLLDIGRRAVDARVPRPARERALRWLLRRGLTSSLFAPALRLGRRMRPLLPRALRAKLQPAAAPGAWPAPPGSAGKTVVQARRVLLLRGCVQPALAPNIDHATARVLDALGVQALVAPDSGCCGALDLHLGAQAAAQQAMRRNVDAWWPLLDQVEAIVVNASACGAMVKDYGRELAHDPAYAQKAARVAALARDPVEFLGAEAPALARLLRRRPAQQLAWHAPCTLQHGQRLGGAVEALLREVGFELTAPAESHLCCGSAGTYSVLQPALSNSLRERKLKNLAALSPQRILSANIGCLQHLQAGTSIPLQHWIEFLDEALRD